MKQKPVDLGTHIEMRPAMRKCPDCGSANLYQEIVEDFLSDEKVNNFRCRNCKKEWSEPVTP